MLTQFYLTKNQHAKINNKSIDNNYYDLHGANRLDTLLLADFTDHVPLVPQIPHPTDAGLPAATTSSGARLIPPT